MEGHSKLRAHTNPDLVQMGDATAGKVRLVGRTTGDEIVAFDGNADLVGTIVTVRATDATPLTILGSLDNGVSDRHNGQP